MSVKEDINIFVKQTKKKYAFKKNYTKRANMSYTKKIEFFTDYINFIIKLVSDNYRPVEEGEAIDVTKIRVKKYIIDDLNTMISSVSPFDALNYGLAWLKETETNADMDALFEDGVLTTEKKSPRERKMKSMKLEEIKKEDEPDKIELKKEEK